ncbi:2,3-dihydro-2,3-dihydroxybenzoate dehydrogenase [Nocardiopsis sp. RSe5-2]|uniref:2,3-dihydro-2,3-dihydroxybenzoate dehydrogenase n=1 Tax=Nocardiopsis endophytica TaxID=3018445 RepID=A0ABT4UAG3_9ACTN|nr:2,3-dihydro-2,3-dihydroxybenzoate dehydrogenase [Nocardiopsis endophytica]MDA2813327.1 2,3-dihydro-2,3-dihydroxybenzoate dehydrogenase [Nocardiopsis endophytica]
MGNGTQRPVAVVTGAAGGIGAAVVRALAERGTAVAAVDRDAEALGVAADKLAADGLTVLPLEADVAAAEEAEAVAAAAEERLGPLEYLVNAAGVLRLGASWKLTAEEWETTFGANASGVFNMARAVVPRMLPRKRGAIVTVASNAAGTARMAMGAYSASKAAAVMYTKCLGLELAEHGIRCNVVAPGSTDTPMLRSMWGPGAGPEATLDGDPGRYRVGIPMRRLGVPEDTASSVVFLLSEESAHITMQTLTVDGGATLGA